MAGSSATGPVKYRGEGSVSERPKEHASKACERESVPWVQIPPLPPDTPGQSACLWLGVCCWIAGSGRLAACTSSASTSPGATASPPASCPGRRRPLAARRGGADRRRDRRGDRALRERRLPGRYRRTAGGAERHRQPAGGGGPESRLRAGSRPVPTRRTPASPSSVALRAVPRLCALLGLDMNPEVPAQAAGDRGLSASGHRRAVPTGPNSEVQEQARACGR